MLFVVQENNENLLNKSERHNNMRKSISNDQQFKKPKHVSEKEKL